MIEDLALYAGAPKKNKSSIKSAAVLYLKSSKNYLLSVALPKWFLTTFLPVNL